MSDSLEYALIFTCLTIFLASTLMLIEIPEPTYSPTLLLSSICAVAFKPTSTITIRIYIPRDVTIWIDGYKIKFNGYPINYGLIEEYLKLELIREYSTDKIILNVKLNSITLIGGRIYELKFTSTNIGIVKISIQRIIGG